MPEELASCAPFDITSVAAAYSALSGVLAGFAFTAIILPLTLSRNTSRHFGPAMMCFTSSFFALLLASIQYAVLSGEIGQGVLRGRAVHAELVSSIPLSVAVLILLYGLCQLFEAVSDRVEVQRAYGLLVNLTATVVPILLMVFGYTISADLVIYRRQMRGATDCVANDGSMVAGGLIVAVGVAAICAFAFRRPRTSVASSAVPVLGIAVALGIGAYSAGVSAFMPSDFVTPVWLQLALQCVTVVSAVLFAFVVTATRGRAERAVDDASL